MLRLLGISSLALVFLARSLMAQAPSSSKTTTSNADDSQEAFVIEQFSRKERFEKDGIFSREEAARVRIQSEAGVQQYGLLDFSYASGTGTFEIDTLGSGSRTGQWWKRRRRT